MFRKDFSIFGPRQRPKTIIPPAPAVQEAPVPELRHIEKPVETVHHSTLYLLNKHNLRQAPPGYWDNKIVNECPRTRLQGSGTVFTPESPIRQAESRQRRDIRERKAQRDERTNREDFFDGPAQRLADTLEEVENVRSDLRDAAKWENMLMEKRQHRLAEQKGWFSDKESEGEIWIKQEAEVAARAVMAMEWTRAHEPPLMPSSASIRSVRSVSTNNRSSMLSTMTITSIATTQRSSIMSTASSPMSSEVPSPDLSSTTENSGNFWKRRISGEEKITPLKLEQPALSQ